MPEFVTVTDVPPTLVAIATYQRPEMLRKLLVSLTPIASGPHRVVVVDNDEAGSAREVVAEFDFAEYVQEREPGIVAARNRGLDELQGEALLAFVDDDEWVADDWLPALYSTMRDYSADVVTGPVLPVYPEGAPRWATEGEYYERKRPKTGTSLRDAATNNTLVTTAALRRLTPARFDHRFSVTGGSDTELFTRLKATGALIVWCDEALSWEHVPLSRISKKWVRQRQRRLGNVRGRIVGLSRPKAVVVGLGITYLGYGVLRMALTGIRRRKLDSFAHMRFWRGIGIIESVRGRFVQEYSRNGGDVGPA